MIKHAGFDPKTAYTNSKGVNILGAVDGLMVQVVYRYEGSCEDGESFSQSLDIYSITCPESGAPISIDKNDEVFREALNDADSDYQAMQAGYA